MSEYSGKCDLYDHMMMEKTYDHGSYLSSDELECFNIFKTKTHGKLYQHHKIKVTEHNADFVKKHCPQFDVEKIEHRVPDKRYKSGFRITYEYKYIYWGNVYTERELNKHGAYITIPIEFNTIIDLMPYYPYIISSASCSNGEEHIIISNESFVDKEFKEHLCFGHMGSAACFHKRLQEHYVEVCQKYFLYRLPERIRQVSLIGYKPLHNGYYEIILPTPADYMHDPCFVWSDGRAHEYWSSPILSDAVTVLVSEQDIEHWLCDDITHNTVYIQYVEQCVFPKEHD